MTTDSVVPRAPMAPKIIDFGPARPTPPPKRSISGQSIRKAVIVPMAEAYEAVTDCHDALDRLLSIVRENSHLPPPGVD